MSITLIKCTVTCFIDIHVRNLLSNIFHTSHTNKFIIVLKLTIVSKQKVMINPHKISPPALSILSQIEYNSQYPDQTSMQFRVDLLNVIKRHGFGKQLFVERHGEAAVYVMAVEDGDTHYSTHEMEVRQMLLKRNSYFFMTSEQSFHYSKRYFFYIRMLGR